MITLKPLAEARVLVVGAGDLINEIVRNFMSYGVQNITVMDATTAPEEKGIQFIKQNAEEFIRVDSDFFKSFDIILSANQPRPFELALSDLRWPKNGAESDPDLPFLVMRSAANTCKMRCQYRELLVEGSKTSKFVSLPMDLLPWTDEKRALVLSTIKNEFKPEQDPTFRAYFTAALAFVEFQKSKGSFPGPQDKEEVQKIAESLSRGSQTTVQDFVDQLCEGGMGAVHETIVILGRLVVLEAIKLLTGNAQPINNTNLEEVIQIVGKSL